MSNGFNAKEILLESYRHRMPRLRGEESSGNWVDIRCFGLPFDEAMPAKRQDPSLWPTASQE